jgi:hypothetical protein
MHVTHYRLTPADYLPSSRFGIRLRIRVWRWHWFLEVGQ